MKVLLVTSLYPVVERNELPKNTSAIHYLMKEWKDDNEIVCINEYRHTITKPRRLLTKNSIRGILGKPYYYEKDKIGVYLLEYVLLPLQKCLTETQAKKQARRINTILMKLQFCPDVIIVHMPMQNIVSYIDKIEARCPRIAVLHSSDLGFMKDELRLKMLENKFYSIFTRSKAIFDEAKGYHLPNLKIEQIHSGVESVKFETTNKKEINNSNELKILYVGTFIKRKGLRTIIEALYQCKDKLNFRCRIIGDGKERKQYEELTRKYGLQDRINFLGVLPREIVFEYMKNSDVFIMVSHHETLGLVYLEAMAHGCITIGSKNEGIDGIIIDGKNGYLVEACNTEELTKCLNKISNTSINTLQQMSDQAIKTAEYYNEIDMSKRYLKIVKTELEKANNKI